MIHGAAPSAVEIPIRSGVIVGDLVAPANAAGAVAFAHGSGSSRHSARNRAVATVLQDAGLATVLVDLLRPDEEAVDERTREHRFDIPLLAERVLDTVEWLRSSSPVWELPLGLFGASTGAAAALVAASLRPDDVGAVVSRGGRPDLAGGALEGVGAPTLLIVGGDDRPVIPLNELALDRLPRTSRLALVPGATHLFEEPGALDAVAALARDWFLAHLVDAGRD